MTGPYVNKTLFEQAKVALPGPKATWDEWATAANKVAKATQTKAAMAWDRSVTVLLVLLSAMVPPYLMRKAN
jgi:alpha-1,4-digalacturonate transport system substrate-binding protein